MAGLPLDPPAGTIRVRLLGTGSPDPSLHRFGPSTLVEVGTEKLLFDAGRGVLQRLAQQKVGFGRVRKVFFTHLHSDHVVGFPDFWLVGWLLGRADRPLRVWGPPGVAKMTSHLQQAYEFDIQIRLSDDKTPPQGVVLETKEVSDGTKVLEEGGVEVTAFLVDHAPVKPAFGYRIDHRGHSVVLSGDTRRSENLVKFAKGADLIVHEVVVPDALRAAVRDPAWADAIINHHTTPTEVGEILTAIKPKLAVYSHLVPVFAERASLLAETRKTYDGKVEVGEDGMVLEVGDTVRVLPP